MASFKIFLVIWISFTLITNFDAVVGDTTDAPATIQQRALAQILRGVFDSLKLNIPNHNLTLNLVRETIYAQYLTVDPSYAASYPTINPAETLSDPAEASFHGVEDVYQSLTALSAGSSVAPTATTQYNSLLEYLASLASMRATPTIEAQSELASFLKLALTYVGGSAPDLALTIELLRDTLYAQYLSYDPATAEMYSTTPPTGSTDSLVDPANTTFDYKMFYDALVSRSSSVAPTAVKQYAALKNHLGRFLPTQKQKAAEILNQAYENLMETSPNFILTINLLRELVYAQYLAAYPANASSFSTSPDPSVALSDPVDSLPPRNLYTILISNAAGIDPSAITEYYELVDYLQRAKIITTVAPTTITRTTIAPKTGHITTRRTTIATKPSGLPYNWIKLTPSSSYKSGVSLSGSGATAAYVGVSLSGGIKPARIDAKGKCWVVKGNREIPASNCLYLKDDAAKTSWTATTSLPNLVKYNTLAFGRVRMNGVTYIGSIVNKILNYGAGKKATKYEALVFKA